MYTRPATLTACALALVAATSSSNSLAQTRKATDSLAGAWQGKVQFTTGAFAAVKDLEFMYAFHAGGTMNESSNYDGAPPAPPAYGVWRKVAPRKYEAKYRFFQPKAVASAEELIKGGGWAPDGYGILTQKLTLSADGNSFDSKLTLKLFSKDGKAIDGGGEATASGKRIRFWAYFGFTTSPGKFRMLTDFEYRYLRRNKRRFKMTWDEAIAAFAAAGIPPLPAFLEFQTVFGGYRPDEDVTYGIVDPTEQDTGDGEPRFMERGGLQLARCDLENRMQIRLQIDQNGVFYYENTPVAESFESYLVFNAYCDQTLLPLGWTSIDPERRATKRFRAFFEKLDAAPVVRRATDQYHSIHQSDQFFAIAIGGNRQLFVRPDLLKGL